jgi:hypothetical protein
MPRIETVPGSAAIDYEVARHVRNEAFLNGPISLLYDWLASGCPMLSPRHDQAGVPVVSQTRALGKLDNASA